MPLTNDSAIERLALHFLDRSLPKQEWTHVAHFAVALWLMRHRPELAEPDAMRKLISAYNEATDTPNSDTGGYHHTITLASLGAAASHLRSHAHDAPLHVVLAALIESPLGQSGWLLAHWRRETLFSVTARHEWSAPDLAALPF